MDFESFVYQNDFAFFIYAVKSLLHSAHFPLIKPMERMKSAIADKPELTQFLPTRLRRKQKTDRQMPIRFLAQKTRFELVLRFPILLP